MSTLKVEVVSIEEILDHPNADRLSLARVKGWICVIPKGVYKQGDLVVYIPIDSLLPEDVENKLFPEDSKIKLTHHRVRTIKIRQAISQGLLTSFDLLGIDPCKEGTNLTDKLNIKKYEPAEAPFIKGAKSRSKKETNPHFFRYTDIENYKNYTTVFKPWDIVCVTCKIHGSSTRYGYLPFHADTSWKKIKLWVGQKIGRTPKWDFVYGSHNVQLQNGSPDGVSMYYKENVYSKMISKYDLKNKIQPNEVVYGEIYGDGIQTGYNYGLKNEQCLVIFDVMKDGVYLNTEDLISWCFERDLPMVPLLYHGVFDFDKIKALTLGPSVLCPEQKIREGVVIKPEKESVSICGRKILKLISDEYLLLKNSDFH